MLAQSYLWNKAPFLRFILPLIAGIIVQWYIQLTLKTILITTVCLLLIIIASQFLSLTRKFIWRHITGLFILLFISCIGTLLVWMNDVRNNKSWFGNYYNTEKETYLLATLQEPLVEKAASYKAEVSISGLHQRNKMHSVTGKAILYFKKDSLSKTLTYGSQILIAKKLDEVKNGGNPGSFDYKRYCLFQGITHQNFLNTTDYVVLPQKNENVFYRFLYSGRSAIINIIRTYIKEPKELGLAEALLIGYKDDLDKNLVQAYTNTGVVHVIAISGLHLGLIYWLLLLLTKPLKQKKAKWLRLILILAGLWLFSLMAGGQPSILRSAVMFSVLALANVIDKRTSIFNTLALSAFLLLCYNPFWLWDVGFQLSYAAVLSIIIFYKPVYNWWYIGNKTQDFFWKMIAVSIAAQILTLSISLYHFHQFPVLFLLANIIAIPLSSGILLGEISLCVLSFITPVAHVLGRVLEWLLWLMNEYIEWLDNVSFAVWDGISISIIQTILLTSFIAGISIWLLEKERKGLLFAVLSFLSFFILYSIDQYKIQDQKKLVVYNVPRYQAIDLISGTDYTFIGDAALEQNPSLRNFHIMPTRILFGAQNISEEAASKFVTFYNKRILVLDTTLHFSTAHNKEEIDVLILSHNPKIYINDLAQRFAARQIIIDGSVPLWKAALWQKDCDSLHIPCYNVSEKGAFVMNIQ
ncbi:MAG TPA: ComEC/Rec2 family competence protein [Chitinophagaceae bacterium]|nr:ComEC/Rec2 family competence protein [Chitinophagaceae bacterium]